MQARGLLTAANYSVHKAAITELYLFDKELTKHRVKFPKKAKPKLILMPERRTDGLPTHSGYARVMLPCKHHTVQREWQVIELKDYKLPTPEPASTIIIQRLAAHLTITELTSWLTQWRASGGKLIYEIDDNLLDSNILIQQGYKDNFDSLIEKVRWLAKNADKVIVSTQELVNVFATFNASVHLAPNKLDEELWRIGKPRLTGKGVFQKVEGDPIRIGLISSPVRTMNLTNIMDAVKRIENEFGEQVEFEVIGAFQNTKPLFGQRVGLPKNNDYPRLANWLQRRVHWDIGIIPSLDDELTHNEAILKFIEYTALRLPVIVSNTNGFSNICKQNQTALLVNNSADAWYGAIKKLIQDNELRTRLAANAYEELQLHHIIDGMPLI